MADRLTLSTNPRLPELIPMKQVGPASPTHLAFGFSLSISGCTSPPEQDEAEAADIRVLKGRVFDAVHGEVFTAGVVVISGNCFRRASNQ